MNEPELTTHEHTYHAFMLGMKWTAIHLAVIIVFLTMWFCTPAGFIWALITAAIVLAAAIYSMRHWLAHSTEGHHVERLHPG